MAWAYGSYVGGRVLVLASTAILARVLTPEDFGLVALALIFISLLETVSDLGVSQALIVAPATALRERAQTAFAFGVALGTGLAIVVTALSPLAAAFFDEPELTAILPVLGANFVLRSLGNTHYALAQRRLEFRSRSAAELGDVAVRGATGIGLALAGFGAWSLVIGYLAGTVALVVILWALVPFRPAGLPRRAHLRPLLRFGGTLSAVDIVAAIIANVDYLMVGRVLGTASLGLYSLGFRLPELLIVNLSVVAGRVLFPALATVSGARRGEAFLRSLRYSAMLSLPLAGAMAMLAEPLTLALFGDQWRGSVDPMRVLTLYAFFVAVGIPAGALYKATGRADILLKLAIPRAVLLIVALLIFVDDGIVAVAACQAGVAALFACIGLGLATRFIPVGFGDIFGAVLAPAIAAVGMAAALVPVLLLVSSSAASLVIGVAVAAATYGGLLAVLAGDSLRQLRDTAFPRAAERIDVPAATHGEHIP